MEVEVTQENFAKSVSNVSRLASSRLGLPILNNILIRTDGKQLTLAATNLEVAATQTIGAKIVKPGSITIPAKLASEFITTLPKGNISLKVQNDSLYISSPTNNAKINGIKDEEFPELPVIDEKKSITYVVDVLEFKKAVNQTTITAGTDSSRPVLTGVFWHTFEGNLYLAATDGYRLSEKRLMPASTDIQAIIPVPTLQEVLRTLSDDIDEIEVLFDDTQVRFRFGESEITSRLIDGNFPDYRQLIPISSTSKSVVLKDEFTQAVKTASLFTRDIGGTISLAVDNEKESLTVSSITSEVGENVSTVSADISGDDGSVSLNSRYLREALSVIDSKKVSFEFSGKLAPCLLLPVEKKADYKHIIMPIKS